MFRAVANRLGTTVQASVRSNLFAKPQTAAATVRHVTYVPQSDEEFDDSCVTYLNRPNITGWQIRSFITHQHGEDLVPEPKVISAVLQACRKVNDYALAVRYLESVQEKAKADTAIWPYIVQEIRPTLDELGVFTPEEHGYDKPELYLVDTEDIH
ncbi:cytochrome c oxidase subunit 5a [Mytilus galloprovincialis]|nr:cytochrome c oxidase subunit 5a [Mytilus galloprovincialis]